MSRIKVFYFIPNLQQGGPERQILELIKRLPPRFEPILCVYHRNDAFFGSELPADQPRYDLGVEKMGVTALLRLTRILRKERPHIVHSYRDKANFWARIAALRAGVPVVISACRNRMMQLRHLVVEGALASRCQAVLTNSEGVRQELVEWARVDPRQIQVIYNFLDLERFRTPTDGERRAARQRWDLPANAVTLLLPGRIGIQKHQVGLLLAIDRLVRSGRMPAHAVLLLAGRVRDRRIGALVERLVKAPRIAPFVRFVGAQQDIRALYWASDALVMPSLYEGLANAALEGSACGLPAILSRAANVDGIVVHGRTGWEVPTGDHRALEATLAEVLQHTPAELHEMGVAARDHVACRFAPHPDYVIDQMVSVYDQLLSQQKIDTGQRLPSADSRPTTPNHT